MAKKTPAGRSDKKTGVKTPRTRRPRSHRGLAKAIFAKRDAVTVGRELLESESATVKARVWETLVTYAFGDGAPKESGSGDKGRVQVICDMPGPPHEKVWREKYQDGIRDTPQLPKNGTES